MRHRSTGPSSQERATRSWFRRERSWLSRAPLIGCTQMSYDLCVASESSETLGLEGYATDFTSFLRLPCQGDSVREGMLPCESHRRASRPLEARRIAAYQSLQSASCHWHPWDALGSRACTLRRKGLSNLSVLPCLLAGAIRSRGLFAEAPASPLGALLTSSDETVWCRAQKLWLCWLPGFQSDRCFGQCSHRPSQP